MVKIRLKRMGAKRHPFYRLVVADARSPRDGRFIEQVGYYDPLSMPVAISIDQEKVEHWLKQGAQPSDAARSLLRREGILAPGIYNVGARLASPDQKAKPGKVANSGGSTGE
ncbi:MAG: 30S ribosomal protein S16 [Candidatus Dormibacteraceae bacterium]